MDQERKKIVEAEIQKQSQEIDCNIKHALARGATYDVIETRLEKIYVPDSQIICKHEVTRDKCQQCQPCKPNKLKVLKYYCCCCC